jgi:hypothetical protein
MCENIEQKRENPDYRRQPGQNSYIIAGELATRSKVLCERWNTFYFLIIPPCSVNDEAD